MQNKKIKPKFVLLTVSVDTLSEAGIHEDDILEIYADKGCVMIQAVHAENFVCDGECEDCPMAEIDCAGECAECPCIVYCEEGEGNEIE